MIEYEFRLDGMNNRFWWSCDISISKLSNENINAVYEQLDAQMLGWA